MLVCYRNKQRYDDTTQRSSTDSLSILAKGEERERLREEREAEREKGGWGGGRERERERERERTGRDERA